MSVGRVDGSMDVVDVLKYILSIEIFSNLSDEVILLYRTVAPSLLQIMEHVEIICVDIQGEASNWTDQVAQVADGVHLSKLDSLPVFDWYSTGRVSYGD